MSRLLKAPSPATVISALALFVALGGAGYAATTIGSKQISDNAVRSADIRDRTILPRDLSPKALSALRGGAGPAGRAGPAGVGGPAGAPGAAATSMFAYVRVDDGDVAEIAYGRGVRAVEQVGVAATKGELDVVFDRDLRGCTVQVTPGTGRPRGEVIATGDVRARVLIDPNDAEGVRDEVARVFTTNGAGAPADAPFLIDASC